MTNNITKLFKSNTELMLNAIDALTDSIGCEECPAKQYCESFSVNEKSCISIFREWALMEE